MLPSVRLSVAVVNFIQSIFKEVFVQNEDFISIKNMNHLISKFSFSNVSIERKTILQPLIDFIQSKKGKNETTRLNFICTHNSRRSHLSQIWATTMGYHFQIKNIFCYSGGTGATALFPKVAETLAKQGFEVLKLSENANPVYAIKYAEDELPIICFSKVYNDRFNPKNHFGAVITCNSADENCPVVFGSEQRFPIKYDDPKTFDGTDLMNAKYAERSLEIAEEMFYVFGSVR
jgi:arsenate reductase